MSNGNYVIDVREPTGGDIVHDNKKAKITGIVPSSSNQEQHGMRLENK